MFKKFKKKLKKIEEKAKEVKRELEKEPEEEKPVVEPEPKKLTVEFEQAESTPPPPPIMEIKSPIGNWKGKFADYTIMGISEEALKQQGVSLIEKANQIKASVAKKIIPRTEATPYGGRDTMLSGKTKCLSDVFVVDYLFKEVGRDRIRTDKSLEVNKKRERLMENRDNRSNLT